MKKYPIPFTIYILISALVLSSCTNSQNDQNSEDVLPTMATPEMGQDNKPEKKSTTIAESEGTETGINSLRDIFNPGSWEYEILDFIESNEMSRSFNLDKVPFEGEELPAEAAIQLDHLTDIATAFPNLTIEIQAHTTAANNGAGRLAKKTASKARAVWVATKLNFRGIDNSRLSTSGMGDEMLLEEIDPEDKAQKRIMAVLTKSTNF